MTPLILSFLGADDPSTQNSTKIPCDRCQGDIDSRVVAKFAEIGRRQVAEMSSRIANKKNSGSAGHILAPPAHFDPMEPTVHKIS